MEYIKIIIEYLDPVLKVLNNFWSDVILLLSGITGLDKYNSQFILVLVLCYIMTLLLLIKFHSKLQKKLKSTIEKCIYQYDKIWYFVSLAMYELNENTKKSGKNNELEHGARSILKLDDNNYFVNRKKIFADIKKLENYLGKTVIEKKIKKNINYLHIKIKFWKNFQLIIGIFLLLITLGIYKLFWKKNY